MVEGCRIVRVEEARDSNGSRAVVLRLSDGSSIAARADLGDGSEPPGVALEWTAAPRASVGHNED
jgi:hypothetical protein